MNGAVEDLLREGLDRLTADVQVPPGVTGRARTHLHRKKMAVRAALAGGAAAVTAAAVVAATAPGEGAAGPVQARTTGYVVSRVAAALAAAATNEVIETRTTFSAPFPPVIGWTYRGELRGLQSGYIAPAQVPGMRWAQGRVSWGVGNTIVGGKKIYVQVDYRHHEWYRSGAMDFVPNGCLTRLDIVEFNGPPDWAPYLRQALSCGMFKVTGHAWIGGVRTIRLTGSQSDPHFWGGLPGAAGHGPMRVGVTLYVNPATYLPVLVVWHNSSHWRSGKAMHGTVRDTIGLLPPTPANKAKAEVTIPAGFRRVHGAPFGGPVSPYFTSG
jgi:hypothetical protein